MKNIYAMSLFSFAAFTVTACSGSNSGSQFLTATDVNVSQVANDSYINLSSTVDLGSAQFDNITVGIQNPKTGENIGTVTFNDVASSTAGSNQGQITLQVNTSILGVGDATLGNSLPNGSPLPASLNLAAGTSLAIPLLNDSRIYVGGNLQNQIFAGVALSISGLSSATSTIGFGANVFFTVPFSSTITGVAGLYTSTTTANDNGIAVFGQYKTAAAAASMTTATLEAAKAKDFSDYEQISTSAKNKLLNFFYGSKRTLHVQ
jgi:hypothetical protein